MTASSHSKTAISDSRSIKKSRKHDTSKKKSMFFPVTNPEEMEICDSPNREFKIVVLRKLKNYKRHNKDKSMKSEK